MDSKEVVHLPSAGFILLEPYYWIRSWRGYWGTRGHRVQGVAWVYRVTGVRLLENIKELPVQLAYDHALDTGNYVFLNEKRPLRILKPLDLTNPLIISVDQPKKKEETQS